MERIYLSVAGDSISVYHRPTHQLIAIGNARKIAIVVKNLLKKSTEDYYKWLINDCKLKPKLEGKKNKAYLGDLKDKEEWFEKAWIIGTNKFLKKYHLKQVNEDIPFELIDDLIEQRNRAHHTKSLLDHEGESNPILEAMETQEEEAINKTPVKLKRRLKPIHKGETKKRKLKRRH